MILSCSLGNIFLEWNIKAEKARVAPLEKLILVIFFTEPSYTYPFCAMLLLKLKTVPQISILHCIVCRVPLCLSSCEKVNVLDPPCLNTPFHAANPLPILNYVCLSLSWVLVYSKSKASTLRGVLEEGKQGRHPSTFLLHHSSGIPLIFRGCLRGKSQYSFTEEFVFFFATRRNERSLFLHG